MPELELIIGGKNDLEPWIGLIGGLIGAVIGAGATGVVSYWVQKREHDRADRLRQADLLQRQRSIAHRIIVKLIAMMSDIGYVAAHMNDSFDGGNLVGMPEPWRFVLPMYVSTDTYGFDGEETALLLDLNQNELFNQIGAMPRIHSQILDLMRTYTTKREQLRAMLPPEAFASDTEIVMTDVQLQHTGPIRAEMNQSLFYLFGAAQRSFEEAQQALVDTVETLRKPLNLSIAQVEAVQPPGGKPNFENRP